jgi:hypothetical protein
MKSGAGSDELPALFSSTKNFQYQRKVGLEMSRALQTMLLALCLFLSLFGRIGYAADDLKTQINE